LRQVATESGQVQCYDVRTASAAEKPAKPTWKLQAHDEAVSAFDVNPVIPGFLVTGSTDKAVKLWSVEEGAGPSMIASRNLDVGKVFTATFAPDNEVGFRLAVAGSKGAVQIWDTSTNAGVRKTFAGRVPERDGNAKERLVRLQEESEESESDEAESGDAMDE
jgi:periodic tryptophan protein 1